VTSGWRPQRWRLVSGTAAVVVVAGPAGWRGGVGSRTRDRGGATGDIPSPRLGHQGHGNPGTRREDVGIQARHLSKRYGSRLAVDDLSFTVEPGKVTGFLGPNGAGKSTTMRLLLGLDRPDRGQARIGGRPYRDLRFPLRAAGALLEAQAAHPGRSARNHLRCLAHTHGLPPRRVDEVIALTGLGGVAGKRAGGFSLGMRQRLGIAAALLGDPQALLLGEPGNGLDPEGVLWIRTMMKQLPAQGRTG